LWIKYMVRLFRFCLILWIALASLSFAQGGGPGAYENWNKDAARAEAVLGNAEASDAALEALRSQIVDWRQTFLDAQSQDMARVGNLEDQLNALAPVPDSGADPLADRRAALSEHLNEARAPLLRAKEAYSRASGLIREIDQIISARRKNALLELGPMPLVPSKWVAAMTEVVGVIAGLADEVSGAINNAASRASFQSNLLNIILQVSLTIAFFFGASRVSARARNLSQSVVRNPRLAHLVAASVKAAMLVAAFYALGAAVLQTNMFGVRGALVLDAMPIWAGYVIAAIFISDRLATGSGSAFELPSDLAEGSIRRTFVLGALIFVVDHALDHVFVFNEVSGASISVLHFVLILLGAYVLSRATVKLRQASESDDAGPDGVFAIRFARLLAQVGLFITYGAPVLGAVGYMTAAYSLVLASLLTLALCSVIVIVQGALVDLYARAIGREREQEDGLVPILISFVIGFASLPFFALIWGARVSNLSEVWDQIKEGVPVAGTRISPLDFLTFVLIFTIGYMATRLIQSALRGSVLPKTRLDAGAQNAIVSGLGYVGIFIAAMIAISSTGLDLSSLAIVAGALSVGIGFGLQNIVSNFVSGIILLIERPVTKGDWIDVGGTMGYVRDISVRSTRIETFDRSDVIVPNADLVSGKVKNYTRGNTIGRLIVPVGVAYGTDTRRVEGILREIAEAQPMVVLNPGPSVVFQGFGADSMDFEIRAILRDVNFMLSVKSEINHQIAERFVAEGIEIPFAQRDITIKNIADLGKGSV
jgi:small-conductance mechanosensitive channel